MVINERNSQINSFAKGMNSDQTYDQLDNQSYVYAKNIRITKNEDINGSEFAPLHEGIVTPVLKGVNIEHNKNIAGNIIAVNDIGNIQIIITDDNNTMRVYRYVIENNQVADFNQLWYWTPTEELPKQVSTYIYKELEGVIKLYIVTGIVPIITLRIDGSKSYINNNIPADVDYLINNRVTPVDQVFINNKISGSLKTGQIQYTYRFYNKFGNSTHLAPLSSKIQVIDSNRNKEAGNAEDTETSIGFELNISTTEYENHFDRMQIFRLHYIKPNEDAVVSIIYDGKIVSQFNDVGGVTLQDLSIKEFATLQGIIIIPKVIEHNQQYMFASNVKDDTLIPNVTADSNQINMVYVPIFMDSTSNKEAPLIGTDSYTGNFFTGYYDGGYNTNQYAISTYIKDRGINPDIINNTYNDIFTSSLFRSLRRGEIYDYGIVYYDKYGRRSDVVKINTVDTRGANSDLLWYKNTPTQEHQDNKNIYTMPIGVEITLPQPKNKDGDIIDDIIGCQIVRRSSKNIYQKTLLQVALAKPVRQQLLYTQQADRNSEGSIITNANVQGQYSPYYPTGFLTSNYVRAGSGYYTGVDEDEDPLGSSAPGYNDWIYVPIDYSQQYPPVGEKRPFTVEVYPKDNQDKFTAHSKDNRNLFQIFSSEIDYRRDDTMSMLSSESLKVVPMLHKCIGFDNINDTMYETNASMKNYYNSKSNLKLPGFLLGKSTQYGYNFPEQQIKLKLIGTADDPISINPIYSTFQDSTNKSTDSALFKYYSDQHISNNSNYAVKNIKDVKIPLWYEGFSNINIDGLAIAANGIKQYKQFNTTVGEFQYNNWISSGLYDLRIVSEESQANVNNVNVQQYADSRNTLKMHHLLSYKALFEPDEDKDEDAGDDGIFYPICAPGFIGPGPSCFLMNIDLGENPDFAEPIYKFPYQGFDTVICNIQHNISYTTQEPDEYVQYFGFGNFFKLEKNGNIYKVVHRDNNNTRDDKMIVFDGDIYITPQELVTMYKTYDFMSNTTLSSMQVVNYVPMESKVNTYFDYGMNYLNTSSKNLLYEAGSIEGIAGQDRPVHQYNMIYSANDESNDVFNLVTTEDSDINEFKQRTYYSEAKTNGEYLDNFLIFKPDAFIDVDSKYGEITNLLTDKNTLYYWQDKAFGKFSVNERSLINDQNGNTIMLGQAGILSRNDYISTKYGMRDHDFSAIAAENGVFWIDINNKAVVASNNNNVVNYGETANVQNIINRNISEDTPHIDYDLQNNELLCKMLNGQQLIFNLKYNIATSVYDRDYDYITYVDNTLFGLHIEEGKLNVERYNYIQYNDERQFMTPLQLQFVVNASASTTKVFDSQQIVPVKRPDISTDEIDILSNMNLSFETDILGVNNNGITNKISTDREGNVIYNVPRFGECDYGNRMRGKWMKVDIDKQDPNKYFTISHAITKFRQSYS